jgi:hypothetical protein
MIIMRIFNPANGQMAIYFGSVWPGICVVCFIGAVRGERVNWLVREDGIVGRLR